MDLLDNVLAKANALPHRHLSRLAFWAGFVLCIYLLAAISWKLVPAPAESGQWRPSPIQGQNSGPVDISGLKQLFGKADTSQPKPEPVAEVITDAPKTSLSIQLTGVVASTSEQNGLAIIDSAGGQETYALGDKIKGTSASLKEVYADRVILTNGGRYETLMLDGLQYTTQSDVNAQLQQAKSDAAVRKVDRRHDREVSEGLSDSREELLADPSKITDYIAISPVNQGDELVGYRLNPGKDPGLFQQAGFKPNDLAKSINGYDLTVGSQALELMAQLSELTEMSVMVEREGQLVEIMFSLPQ
ncbi:type II secretion system protein GspC [Shewanella sedimentimangrovi]|uniref:Type II secretion system protein GspC n=1 Tax=Shewanella sedimentimangrovi TaxID=2814293 RepID=A0ABX7R3M7_9GAMM|nr:type II secretion system protein GspC [Shewanella sedimentimangrovi]QSX37433.1 type II secretion system protein GspC [Shewanella sedimentimangrovi]